MSPDGSLDVVPGDHECDDVGGVELGDGAVCLLLDEVLHDDQPQEVSSLLQLGPRQLVYLGELHPVLRKIVYLKVAENKSFRKGSKKKSMEISIRGEGPTGSAFFFVSSIHPEMH